MLPILAPLFAQITLLGAAPIVGFITISGLLLLLVLPQGRRRWKNKKLMPVNRARAPSKVPRLQKPLMSATQLDFFSLLKQAVEPTFFVAPRLPLGAIFRPPVPSTRSAVIDFVICAADRGDFVALVNLRPSQKAEDHGLKRAADQVGLLFLQLPPAMRWSLPELRRRLPFIIIDPQTGHPKPLPRLTGPDILPAMNGGGSVGFSH